MRRKAPRSAKRTKPVAAKGAAAITGSRRAAPAPRPAATKSRGGKSAGGKPARPKAASRGASVPATPAAPPRAAEHLPPSAFGREQLLRQRIEDLGQGYVSMAAELWIVKDRLAVLEEVLARHGIPAPSAVDTFEPAGEFKARLDAQRREWTRRIIGALFPRGLPEVD